MFIFTYVQLTTPVPICCNKLEAWLGLVAPGTWAAVLCKSVAQTAAAEYRRIPGRDGVKNSMLKFGVTYKEKKMFIILYRTFSCRRFSKAIRLRWDDLAWEFWFNQINFKYLFSVQTLLFLCKICSLISNGKIYKNYLSVISNF